MAQSDLRRVRRVAQRRQRVDQELVAAILKAREAGETYRDIAKAAGVSHQTVWQLLKRQPPGTT
jgi:AcrR family transcriptional regulator